MPRLSRCSAKRASPMTLLNRRRCTVWILIRRVPVLEGELGERQFMPDLAREIPGFAGVFYEPGMDRVVITMNVPNAMSLPASRQTVLSKLTADSFWLTSAIEELFASATHPYDLDSKVPTLQDAVSVPDNKLRGGYQTEALAGGDTRLKRTCTNDPDDCSGPITINTADPIISITSSQEVEVSGGVPPYGYAWSGILSGDSSVIGGVVTESGWLRARVGDQTGGADQDSVRVEVSEMVENCPI